MADCMFKGTSNLCKGFEIGMYTVYRSCIGIISSEDRRWSRLSIHTVCGLRARQAFFRLLAGVSRSLGHTPFPLRQDVIAFNSRSHALPSWYVRNRPSCVDVLCDKFMHLTYWACLSGHFFAAAQAINAASRFLQGFLSGSFARKQP